MNNLSVTCILLVSCLLLSAPVEAESVGIRAGDSMVFAYTIITTYKTANRNATATTTTEVQVNINSVNATGSLGQFGYTETLINFNGTDLTTDQTTTYPSATNFTTIFNPYDNLSYTGNIGFWPVIATDVVAGTVKNLDLNNTYRGNSTSGPTTYNAVVHVNATVTKADGLIDVDMHWRAVPNQPATPAVAFVIEYNATTGVMKSYHEEANIYGPVEKVLEYNLVTFVQKRVPNYDWVAYVLLAAVAAVVVAQVARRKPKAERQRTKVKEKFARIS